MKIAFVVNDVATERHVYTTVRLAMTAKNMGHEAWLIGVGDLGHDASGEIIAHAHTCSGKQYKSLEKFLGNIQSDEGVHERISVDELDALVLRNDPADDAAERPWAVASGILFAQLAVARGVLVVNDPASLANAINKTYFQHFPEAVRPKTLISRDRDDIVEFVDSVDGRAVLKPLQGSGGSSVFMVNSEESPNLNQMVEAISRDGYVVAQEYLPAAEKGDVRLFVLNAHPLEVDGRIAAFRRVNSTEDIRSNMHAGGTAEAVDVTDEMLAVVDLVRPKLLEDGMFLVGLDIVGDKLMEINVFSPGGLGSCEELYDIDFAPAVIEALEFKTGIKQHYSEGLTNTRLAVI